MRASHDCLETFVRVSHDVRANFNLFYFLAIKSRNGLINLCRIFVALCRSRELPSNVFVNVCYGWRRVRDICDDLARVL